MNLRSNLRLETLAVVAMIVAAVLFRWGGLERVEVEHFDEGVYASSLWYDEAAGTSWPNRELYAPPLLSELIRISGSLPGFRGIAPFLPSLLAGTLMPIVLWWMARGWFGRAAGLAAATLVTFSDFHILYSRMALTDVLSLLLICGAVHLGTAGISRDSLRTMVFAGVVCSLAMWAKYTGWLPLAIVSAAGGFWWILEGRRRLRLGRLCALLTAMIASTFIGWLPWLLSLQSTGGYAAVAANHSGYVQGFGRWQANLIVQLGNQLALDGLPAQLSVGLAIFVAAVGRWRAAGGFTWNRNQAGDREPRASARTRVLLLLRFLFAAVAMTVMAMSIQTPLLLLCIAMGGMSGFFMWPVLERSYLRRVTGDRSPTSPGSLPLSAGDLQWAPTLDPALGGITILTWFLALLAVTPMYQPYPRLFLPFNAALWLAAAAGISWWLESNVSITRRAVDRSQPGGSLLVRLVSRASFAFLVLAMIATLVIRWQQGDESLTFSAIREPRDSMLQSARQISRMCGDDVSGRSATQTIIFPGGTIITPDKGAELPDGTIVPLSNQTTRTERPNDIRTDSPPPRVVVYAFGEPALLFHLNQLGITAAPVDHLALQSPPGSVVTIPAYLVFGPNAKRSDGFWEKWLTSAAGYRYVGSVEFQPSRVVLLNLFTPAWQRQHPECSTQVLEVYRIE